MEDTLGGYFGRYSKSWEVVLILVLMEETLGGLGA